jgi:hypothetical protein
MPNAHVAYPGEVWTNRRASGSSCPARASSRSTWPVARATRSSPRRRRRRRFDTAASRGRTAPDRRSRTRTRGRSTASRSGRTRSSTSSSRRATTCARTTRVRLHLTLVEPLAGGYSRPTRSAGSGDGGAAGGQGGRDRRLDEDRLRRRHRHLRGRGGPSLRTVRQPRGAADRPLPAEPTTRQRTTVQTYSIADAKEETETHGRTYLQRDEGSRGGVRRGQARPPHGADRTPAWARTSCATRRTFRRSRSTC